MSATTPRRANMAAQHSPSKTPSRRVLGDLTPKALNTPSKQTKNLDVSEAMRAQSPLKQVATLSPQVLTNKENFTGAATFTKGRKRSIYEVEGAENVGSAKSVFRGRDTGIVPTEDRLMAAAALNHTDTSLLDLGEPGSPTEANTPSPPPDNDMNFMNSQETNQSFSMFVNYGACDSQNSVQDQPAAPTSAPMKKDPEPGAGKKSRAELLRLRLGFGLYKVKTNQVSRRGSDIISTWELSSSSEALDNTLAAAIPSSTDSNITIQQNQVPSITLSPARKSPKPAFVKANLDPFRPIGKLEHVPVLLPTAVSSRTIQDYHIPSSPPQTDNEPLASPPDLDEDNLRTPTAKRTRRDSESDHKDAAESPANDDDNNNKNDDDDDDDHSNAEDRDESVQERLQRLREKRLNNEGELTSSAVKGHAAKGLLELMSGRR